jgi:O-acetyl-ADP-ribose deacetylase (regulator of RNase III)
VVHVLTEVAGDLLADDAQALVNPVNTAGVMGKGLALQFKRAYPEAFRAYAAACRRGEIQPGRLHLAAVPGDRLVVNFPTKRHWREPSRLEDVASGLDDLARVITDRGIRSIAVPPLGCGLGGLPWTSVRLLLRTRLSALDCEVRLYVPASARGAVAAVGGLRAQDGE